VEHGAVKKKSSLLAKYLRRKEQLLMRNKQFQKEARDFEASVPTVEEFREWPKERQIALNLKTAEFARKWGCHNNGPWSVTKEPFGGGKSHSNLAMGVVLMSPMTSRLVVVGIDPAMDLDVVCTCIKEEVRMRREFWKQDTVAGRDGAPDPAWKQHQYGPDKEEELGEVIAAWDLKEKKFKQRDIARTLFPGEDLDSSVKKVQRRLRRGRELIEKEGYRNILPLTTEGVASDLVYDFHHQTGRRRR
jgi:hypothetical protein